MSLYVTVAEYKQAPTAVDVSRLDQTAIGNQNAQDTALLNVLRRASSWVDNICRVDTLEATTNTETKEVHAGRDGRITVWVDNIPIISVSSVQYRVSPNTNYTTIDPTYIQAFDKRFTVFNVNATSLGPNLILQPLTMGYYSPYRLQQLADMPITIQYTYLNGYFNSTLNGNVLANATTLTVLNASGTVAGTQFTIYDGPYQETCTVQSVNGNTITLTSPLLFAHNTGVSVSAIPADIKQAAILLASVLIKDRGSSAVVMSGTSFQGVSTDYPRTDDIALAKSLLSPYVKVVGS